MSNYAIGDLQGCYEELQQLLTQIDFDKKKDVLWFCGTWLTEALTLSIASFTFIRLKIIVELY